MGCARDGVAEGGQVFCCSEREKAGARGIGLSRTTVLWDISLIEGVDDPNGWMFRIPGTRIIPLCTTAAVETLPMPNIELYLSIVMMLAPVLVCNGINRLSPVACPNTSTKPSSNALCLIIIINALLLSLYFFRPSPSILMPPKTWSPQPHLLAWAWAPSRKRSGSALSFPFPSRSSVLVRDRGYDHVRSLAPCRPLVAHRRAGRRSRNRSRMSLMRTRHSTRLLPWVGGRCSILCSKSH